MNGLKINRTLAAILGLTLYALLALGYNLSDYISDEHKSMYLHIERGVQAFIIVFGAWLTTRMAQVFIWDRYELKSGKHAPDMIKSGLGFVIYFSTGIYILMNIYDQSYAHVIAVGGALGVGLGLGLQGLILDAFAGVVIQVEEKVEVGDWIEIHGLELAESHGPAEVVNMTWRAIIMRTHLNYLVVIPFSMLTKTMIKNYSRPHRGFTEFVTVSIDHDVPISRAKAIIHEALLSIDGIDELSPPEVWAKLVNEGGVVYEVRFTVDSYRLMKRMRHKILEAVARILHSRDLRISETLGVMPFQVDDLEMRESPANYDTLRNATIFDSFSSAELKILAKKCKRLEISFDQYICREGDPGDSMFIIVEGVVDILKQEKKQGKKESEQLLLAKLRAGDYLGEMSLLTGKPRTADVRASSTIEVLEITKENLMPLMKKRKSLAEDLGKIVATRQTATQAKLKDQKAADNALNKMSKELSNQIKAFFGFAK